MDKIGIFSFFANLEIYWHEQNLKKSIIDFETSWNSTVTCSKPFYIWIHLGSQTYYQKNWIILNKISKKNCLIF